MSDSDYHAATERSNQSPDVSALRRTLVAAGFTPVPLYGKAPRSYRKNGAKKGLGGWRHLEGVTSEQIDAWARDWDAINTGILTRFAPALDLDILNEEAAIAAEDFVRARFEERGTVLVRIGTAQARDCFPYHRALSEDPGQRHRAQRQRRHPHNLQDPWPFAPRWRQEMFTLTAWQGHADHQTRL